MVSPKDMVVNLKQEAASYPDGSYNSNLNLGAAGVIESLMQDIECLNESNEKLTKMLSQNIKKYKKPGKKKGAK